MDDPQPVQRDDRAGELNGDLQSLPKGDEAVFLQPVRQRLAAIEGHHRVEAALPLLAHGQHLTDKGAGDANAEDRKSTTSELQSLMRISYAVFCLKKKKKKRTCK